MSSSHISRYFSVLSSKEAKIDNGNIAVAAEKTQALSLIEGLFQSGVLEEGGVTGVAYRKTHSREAVYKTESVRVYASLPACWDGPVPEDQWENQEVFDHFRDVEGRELDFAESKKRRSDIVYDGGRKTLYVSAACLDEDALKKAAVSTVLDNPQKTLPFLVGEKKAGALLSAFREVAGLKPLSVQDSLVQKKADRHREAVSLAAQSLRDAVESADLADILGEKNTAALVRQQTGLKI